MTSAERTAALTKLALLQRRRKFYISNVNKQTNAAGALVRLALGWRYDADEGTRERVKARAARIVAAALAGKEQKEEDQAVFADVASDLTVVAEAIEKYVAARNCVELDMKRIVRTLPIYAWAESMRGFGELGLAVILAEAGDLSSYPKKGHLWKRLGLAPVKGKACSTWRMEGGLTSIEWEDAGYAPRRRAEVYACVQESLVKHQLVGKEKAAILSVASRVWGIPIEDIEIVRDKISGDRVNGPCGQSAPCSDMLPSPQVIELLGVSYGLAAGPYGAIYIRRREHLETAHPDWTPKHCQMDAMRVMVKYLLRDLWREWNEQGKAKFALPERAKAAVPTSAHLVAAE